MEKDNKRRKIFLNCLKSILIILFFSKSVPQALTEDSKYSYVMMKLPKGNALKFYNSGIPRPNEIHINGNIEKTWTEIRKTIFNDLLKRSTHQKNLPLFLDVRTIQLLLNHS